MPPAASLGFAFAALGGFIAVAISTVEALVRHKDVASRHVFFCWPFLLLASLNWALAVIFFYATPYLESFIAADGFKNLVFGTGIGRALASAFGYQLLARTSIFDFKFRDQQVGVGFDFVYSALSSYLISQQRKHVRDNIRRDCQTVYGELQDHRLTIFYHAALTVVYDDDVSDRLQTLRVVCSSNVPTYILCAGLYQIIRSGTTDAVAARDRILASRDILLTDAKALDETQAHYRTSAAQPPPILNPPPGVH